MVDELKNIMELLQVYGGWATTVFLGIAFIRFYRDFKTTVNNKDSAIERMNKERHEEMVAVVRECTGVLVIVNESLERCEKRQEHHYGCRDENLS